ncbi:MAG: chemotaxis protein CheA, partial [Planctomycetota bacterium]
VERVDIQALEVDPQAATPEPSKAAVAGDSNLRPLAPQAETVRVETVRLDEMMNIAGELVITKARVSQLGDELNHCLTGIDIRLLEHALAQAVVPEDRRKRLHKSIAALSRAQDLGMQLRDGGQELHRHTGQLQNAVMQARMVPIGPLFQRFHRLVRDLCKERDRQARLVSSGEGTELDKKLIDELADPLTHLIRNGVDHGLESSAERSAAGKPEAGSITLAAFHEGGQICIRVADDGKGLDFERIRAKAVSKGLLSAEAAGRLSDDEAGRLIFEPGFSTAAAVTNISGRGVGMDIVRSKVQELKGSIDIDSTPGAGTAFTIRLPLTLAMIEALLVRIGSVRYAFPLESVREIVDVGEQEIRSVEGRGRVLNVRGSIIAYTDLEPVMGLEGVSDAPVMRAVVTKGGRETLAIPVDQVLGYQEIVVKSLTQEFVHVRGLAGATVLGDGGIALILDVMGIGQLASRRQGVDV